MSSSYTEADVAELERLVSLVSPDRPNVKQLLESQITFVRAKIPQPAQEIPKPLNVAPVSPSTDLHYETIPGYAWENQDKVVKVYVELADVGTLPKEKITATVFKNSERGQDLVLLVHGLHNKNYRLRVTNLFGKVSHVTINQRTQRIVLSLHKDGSTHWSSLQAKDKSSEPKMKDTDADVADPGAGIMNMMKKLYDDGDEEMKRTIAKAWTESKNKEGNPLL